MKLKNNPKYLQLLYWGKLVSITGIGQIIVQVLGFASGILIIRLLTVQEYALFVLANTLLGTMTVLGDGGVSTGVLVEGGKVWQDKNKLGKVLYTGIQLKKKFSIISLCIAIPILLYLLMKNNAGWETSILISLCLIPAFYANLSDSLLQIIPKLHKNVKLLQKNQVFVSLGRLFLIGSSFLFIPFAATAILADGISRIYGNIKLKKIAKQNIVSATKKDEKVEKEILKIVKRVMPGSVYYAFSSQLNIWLISFFGSTSSIAQIGALSRFMIISNFIMVVFEMVFVPAFAKIQNPKIVVKRFFLAQIGVLFISIFILGIFYICSEQLLWILGDDYKGLDRELYWITGSLCIGLFSLTANKLLSSRGIIVPPFIFIVYMILIQLSFAFVVDLSTLIGIIQYGILTTLFIYFFRVIYLFIHTKNKI
jgi:O-antigen/teichoic acid export membrane protein